MWQSFIDFFIRVIEYTYELTVKLGVPSYGLAIVFMSIAIKLIMFPINQYQLNSMRRMQQLTPKMKELQERYKYDKAKLNEKIAELYSENKVNPLGGCLPLLVQMPIFIAFYRALSSMEYTVAEHAGFLWVPNIAEPDPYYGFAILAALTTFIQQRVSMADMSDKTQRAMLFTMPLMMGWLAVNLPAGLPLYWVVFNVLGILQQIFVNKRMDPKAGTAAKAVDKSEETVPEEDENGRGKGKKKGKNKEVTETDAGSGDSKKGKNR